MTCFAVIYFYIFPTIDESFNYLKITVSSLFGATMLFWLVAWLKDPGF